VPFLGGTLEVPLGAFRLAAMTGARVVPVFSPRASRGKVDIEVLPALDSAEDEIGSAMAFARVLEGVVRRFRAQWMCMHTICLEDRALDGRQSSYRPAEDVNCAAAQ